MAAAFVNRFGRRPGRGIRPWLLLPKVIAVMLYAGGLASLLVLWTGGLSPGLARRLALCTIVPGAACANVLGLVLLLQHPRVFLRMRWLVVKLISLAVIMPASHLFLATRLAIIRGAAESGMPADDAAAQFTCGLVVALAGAVWIIVLGRLKPRFGQNPAARGRGG